MSITAERAQEILQLYAQFKEDILDIDHKYSLSYHEPELDLPPSLNLVKLTFTPKTEGELVTLATQTVEPIYTNKLRVLQQGFLKSKQNFENSKSHLAENLRVKLLALLDDYTNELATIHRRIVNNGLMFSSIESRAREKALDSYNDKVTNADNHYQQELSVVQGDLVALDERYQQGLSQLDEEKQQRIQQEYNDLVYAQQKEGERIAKYNQTLDEKETKYQASVERTMQYARQAEYDRSINASRLFAELGESGVQGQKMSEKYDYSCRYFIGWKKEEALSVVQSDSFLQGHLGSYYASFIDWINATLT